MTSPPQPPKTFLSSLLAILRRTLAVALALCAAYAVFSFPTARPVMAAALVLYATALYRYPSLWMLIVPTFLPVVDLASWSGRFFLDEFDFLAMTSLAVLYWRRADGRILPGLFARPYLPVTLMALSYGAGVALSLYPPPPIEINSFSTYLSPYNALRVAKGFFWAWLFMPIFLREWEVNPIPAKQRLMTGISAGLGLAGICVLWERGVFVDLFWGRNIYALAQSLLDFTSSYRITGMFSGMHVGGTAIDGYLALAVPLSLYPVIYGKSPWARLTGLGVFSLGGYAIVVTFSRGLYAAFGLALLIIIAAYIIRLRHQLMAHLWRTSLLLMAFIFATGLLYLLYLSGGYEALLFGTAAVAASGLAASQLKTNDLKILIILWIAGSICVAALIHHSLAHHKYSLVTPDLALLLAGTAALLLFALPAAAARRQARGINRSTAIIASFLLAVFWMGIIPPLSSVRVSSRFSTSGEDFETRKDHWRDSLAAMTNDWPHRMLGMGVGSFPRIFMPTQIGNMPLASYRFEGAPEKTYMTLGSGDFNMIQRVSLKPHTIYRVQLDTRTGPELGGVEIRLCHKHILFSDRYIPDCRVASLLAKTQALWLTQNIELNSGGLGSYGIFYWPSTFILTNNGKANIQVTNISLTGPDGVNLIKNGDFATGADHWFLTSDFEHLAWHTENMFFHLYFEQGLIGLAFFLFLTTMAIFRLLSKHRNGDTSAVFQTAGICAFLVVGLFSTSLDMPRTTFLFYFILFASLAPLNHLRRNTENISA